jgi:hypothetical protein
VVVGADLETRDAIDLLATRREDEDPRLTSGSSSTMRIRRDIEVVQRVGYSEMTARRWAGAIDRNASCWARLARWCVVTESAPRLSALRRFHAARLQRVQVPPR